jgi:secondary thiamine-phosphate synthase enzyme
VKIHQKSLSLTTRGKGLIEITGLIETVLQESGLRSGTVTVFCRHTSCSLVLMENADPSARRDLEDWLDRLVKEDDPHFEHVHEGPDDMPSHIKMALTRSSETIPFDKGQLLLGTWQGCFLWEHRAHPHNRSVHLTLLGNK